MLRARPHTSSSYAFNNDACDGRVTPLLKPKMFDEGLVSSLFRRRKSEKSVEGNVCPYCEFINEDNAETCVQCYYSLNLAPRNQPMATPTTSGMELMNTLMEIDVLEEEEFAVEAVLSLDEVAVEVDQYEVSKDEEEDSFQFIRGSTPELSQTVEFEQQDEVELKASDAPKNPVVFDLGDENPLDEVVEPVPTGLGNLYSPSIKNETDEDLMGSIGPVDLVNTPTPDLPNFSNLTHPTASTPQPPLEKPSVAPTPEIPVMTDSAMATGHFVSTPVPNLASSENIPHVETPEIPTTTQISEKNETVEVPIANNSETSLERTPAPTPQIPSRFWPWPERTPWDARQVYREVVSILESIKSGQLTKAAETLDALGPHLEYNFDMLLHIGSAMRALNREEHLQWTLSMAKHVHPNNEHVVAAVAQLS